LKTDLSTRDKLILSGLYLSKYDSAGLAALGFDSFIEAFNAIGYALGSKPASVKNYRDEFDPLFPNSRRGWHKRPMREYCRQVMERFRDLDFETFTGLVGSFFDYDANAESAVRPSAQGAKSEASFAQRLITGLAAERYFEEVQPTIPIFQDYLVENTTKFGCGYDYRLRTREDAADFVAVEVKGLRDATGSIAMTPKEYQAATTLKASFFLFVVRNFRESPSHKIFRDPASGPLQFRRAERVTIQISWSAAIGD